MKTAMNIIGWAVLLCSIFLYARVVYGQEVDITPPVVSAVESTDSDIIDPLDLGALPQPSQPTLLTVTVFDYAFQNTNIYCILGGSFDGVNWIKLASAPSAPAVQFNLSCDDASMMFRAGNQFGP